MEHMVEVGGKMVRVRVCGVCGKVVERIDMATGDRIMRLKYASLLREQYICSECTVEKIRNMSGFTFLKK